MPRSCKLLKVDGRTLTTPTAFSIPMTRIDIGRDIYEQQRQIPNYDPMFSYVIECDGVQYDIDRIGWMQLS